MMRGQAGRRAREPRQGVLTTELDSLLSPRAAARAHNPLIVDLISAALWRPVLVPDYAQDIGVLGTAFIARRK